MTAIHKPLENASFERPAGLVEKTACKASGCLANQACSGYTEIFTEDNIPEQCAGHGTQTLCADSGLVATEYCPNTKVNIFGNVPPKEKLKLWKALSKSGGGTKVEQTCNIHTPKPSPSPKTENTNKTNTTTNTANTSNTTNTTNTSNTSEKVSILSIRRRIRWKRMYTGI